MPDTHPGYDTKYTTSGLAGNRNVAIKNWSVDVPSIKEVTTFVRVSDNLFLFSEDFEFAPWVKTLGGGTHTPNDAQGALTRKADKFVAGSGTKIEQLFTGSTNQVFTFSAWIKTASASNVTISIIDGLPGVGTVANTLSDTWERLVVTRTLASGSGIKVAINFSADAWVWGGH